jgi:hypothetical protein
MQRLGATLHFKKKTPKYTSFLLIHMFALFLTFYNLYLLFKNYSILFLSKLNVQVILNFNFDDAIILYALFYLFYS